MVIKEIMFDEHHYVPVLRWKQSEWLALRYLDERVKGWITPLIEIPPSVFSPRKNEAKVDIDNRLFEIANKIAFNWGQKNFFLDLKYIDSNYFRMRNDTHVLIGLANALLDLGLKPIFATDISRDAEYQTNIKNLIRRTGGGLCLRVNIENCFAEVVSNDISEMLRSFNLSPAEINLILDHGFVDNLIDDHLRVVHRIPDLASWRTISFSGGSFPADLQGFTQGVHKHPRHDWMSWKTGIGMWEENLGRIPTYSDHTIQHPIFKEPPEHSNPSASIRYTCDECWLILRGEGLRTSETKHRQYIGHALMLIDHKDYSGRDFSHGDEYISEVAGRIDLEPDKAKPGSPMTWLRAGVNHHITFVTRQLSSLFGYEEI